MSEEMLTSPFENPAWFDGRKINEVLFCEEFLRENPMITVNGVFFTVDGRVYDENRLLSYLRSKQGVFRFQADRTL